MKVYKQVNGWVLVFDNPDKSKAFDVFLTKEVVNSLVDELNNASCKGADWPIYEESYR